MMWHLSHIIVVLVSILAVVQSQILAIDYGTQFIKASLVHAGAGKAFSIVENPKSQRKFINAVSLPLFSLDSTKRNVSTKQILLPNDHEDLLIASSTHIF